VCAVVYYVQCYRKFFYLQASSFMCSVWISAISRRRYVRRNIIGCAVDVIGTDGQCAVAVRLRNRPRCERVARARLAGASRVGVSFNSYCTTRESDDAAWMGIDFRRMFARAEYTWRTRDPGFVAWGSRVLSTENEKIGMVAALV